LLTAEPPSNESPDSAPDKTGNNRDPESETTNTPIFLTPLLPNPPAQTISNETADRSPDKTGNNREIKFEELNFDYRQVRSKRVRNSSERFSDFAKALTLHQKLDIPFNLSYTCFMKAMPLSYRRVNSGLLLILSTSARPFHHTLTVFLFAC
jgi:hypothetical protein